MPKREIERFDPTLPIEKSHTPPFTWYTDEKILQMEKEEIFQKEWLCVGYREQLEKPGQYITGEVLGNPYVVVRDDKGELHAFHNVCRHHAALVAQECGTCTEFVCPYHGWQYQLDGSLKKAPHLGKQDGFDPDRYGLKKMAVETWGPFVFIDLDGPWGGNGNPRGLHKDADLLWEHLKQTGMENLKHAEHREYEMNCNWKVFVDNSLDGGYHVAYAHEDLAEGLESSMLETIIEDYCAIQIGGTNGDDKRLGDKVMYAWLYPNLFINRYGNMMDVNVVVPHDTDPQKCKVIFDFFFDYHDHEEWSAQKRMRKDMARSHAIQQEDVEVCESAQKGMNSMSYHYGRYSTSFEQAVHHFHKMVWKSVLNRGVQA